MPGSGPAIAGAIRGLGHRLADRERELLAQVSARMPEEDPAPVRVDRTLDDGDVLGFGDGAPPGVLKPG